MMRLALLRSTELVMICYARRCIPFNDPGIVPLSARERLGTGIAS